jgi:DNA polymerase-3 subunit alpha
MFGAAGRVLEQAAALHRERQSGQSSLFGEPGEGGVKVVAPALPPGEPWSLRDRSAREKEVLGFYLSEHPLEPLRDELARVATHAIAEAAQLEHGTEVRLAGLVGEVRGITTRTGKRMAAVTIEDLSGRIECTVFPETYEASRATWVAEELVVVAGRVENQDERGARLLISEVRGWEQARSAYRPSLHIEVRAEQLSPEWLGGVDEVLSAHAGDSEVFLHIIAPNRARHVSRSKRYRVAEGAEVIAALQRRFPDLNARWRSGTT